MKRMLVFGGLVLAIALAGSMLKVNAVEKEESMKQLRHIVMFKFTSEDAAKEISEAFVELPKAIEEVKGFEWGKNVSKEGLDKGLTHAFTLTFDSQEALDAYIVHAAHKGFVAKLDGKVADVCVFDYWTK